MCYVVPGPSICHLQDTSLNELLSGRHNLNNEMSERTGQLKALVSEVDLQMPDAPVLLPPQEDGLGKCEHKAPCQANEPHVLLMAGQGEF